MHPSRIVEQLRSSGLYPALFSDRIRLYGDVARLTRDLRDALTLHREGIIEYLQADGQQIAYDVIDVLSRDGWHPTVIDEALIWRRGAEQSPNPMPTVLRDALAQHTTEVIRVLRQVPTGCMNRAVCEHAGICADEITDCACFERGQETREQDHGA